MAFKKQWISVPKKLPSGIRIPPIPQAAPSAHKLSHYVRKTIATLLRKTPRATPQGANFRASESKSSSSLECSAERSRKSTQLKLVCEYRTAGLPVKSSPPEKGKVLIKREQCQMHLNIAEREGLRRSQSI